MRILIIYSLVVVQVAAVTATAIAETTVPVRITSTSEPPSASGIVLSPSGTIIKEGLSAKRDADGVIAVEVPVSDNERSPDTLVSAYVLTEDRRLVFGEMQTIGSSSEGFWSVPECPPSAPSMNVISSNEGLLNSLVKIREQRIKVSHAKFSELLTGKYLDRLRGVEKALGISREPALGPDLPPLELIERLNIIINSVKAREQLKVRQDANAAAEAAAIEAKDSKATAEAQAAPE